MAGLYMNQSNTTHVSIYNIVVCFITRTKDDLWELNMKKGESVRSQELTWIVSNSVFKEQISIAEIHE